MTLRPELTPKRAISAVVRWSWLIAIIAVCTAVAGRAIAEKRSGTTYTASVQVHLQQVKLDNTRGFPSADRLTPKSFPDGSVFLDPAAAKAAADKLKTVTREQLLADIKAAGVDVDTALLTYSAPSRAAAATNLSAYATAFVDQRRAEQTSELTNAMPEEVQSYRANGTPRTDIGLLGSRANLTAAIAGVPDRVRRGDVQIEQQPASLSPNAATLTGLLAGLAMGVLLALALNRFDPRVRRGSELGTPGVKAFPTTPSGRASLRVDLELTAVGTDGGVVALSDVDGRGAEGAAIELARAFVAAGTPALVLEMTVDPTAGGIRSFMDGSSTSLPVSEIAPDLRWVGGGSSELDDASLFSAEPGARAVRGGTEIRSGGAGLDRPALGRRVVVARDRSGGRRGVARHPANAVVGAGGGGRSVHRRCPDAGADLVRQPRARRSRGGERAPGASAGGDAGPVVTC